MKIVQHLCVGLVFGLIALAPPPAGAVHAMTYEAAVAHCSRGDHGACLRVLAQHRAARDYAEIWNPGNSDSRGSIRASEYGGAGHGTTGDPDPANHTH